MRGFLFTETPSEQCRIKSAIQAPVNNLEKSSFSPKYLFRVKPDKFSQINGSKLPISTERRSVNKMSFLCAVSLNFVKSSIVCAKFVISQVHMSGWQPDYWLNSQC